MTLLWVSFLWGAAFGCAARWGRFCLLRGVRQGMGHDHSEPRGHAQPLQALRGQQGHGQRQRKACSGWV